MCTGLHVFLVTRWAIENDLPGGLLLFERQHWCCLLQGQWRMNDACYGLLVFSLLFVPDLEIVGWQQNLHIFLATNHHRRFMLVSALHVIFFDRGQKVLHLDFFVRLISLFLLEVVASTIHHSIVFGILHRDEPLLLSIQVDRIGRGLV